MNKKILYITYVFPPNAAVGVYRVIYTIRHLFKLNWNINVLTVKNPTCYAKDFGLINKVKKKCKITYVPNLPLITLHEGFKGRVLDLLLKPIRFFLRPILKIVDPMFLWILPGLLKGISFIKKYKISVILSTSPPISAHILAVLLKRFTGVKVFLDFRDLYASHQGKSLYSKNSKILENWLVKSADGIFVTTEYSRKLMQKRYPDANIFTVYNGFQEEEYSSIRPEKFDKFTIIHTGSFYAGRSPEPLINALKLLKDNGKKELIRNLQCIFVGNKDENFARLLESYENDFNIINLNYRPHSEVLNLLYGADIAYLVLDDDHPEVLPAKTFEYLLSGKPILAVVPEGEVYEILNKAGHQRFDRSDIHGIAKFIEEKFNQHNDKVETNLSLLLQFERGYQIQKMSNILQECSPC